MKIAKNIAISIAVFLLIIPFNFSISAIWAGPQPIVSSQSSGQNFPFIQIAKSNPIKRLKKNINKLEKKIPKDDMPLIF